ncbi:MAG TPA: YqgE/AlgH family protein [Magnetospirillaceae bacterium]|jgi:putative transcriptional regulator
MAFSKILSRLFIAALFLSPLSTLQAQQPQAAAANPDSSSLTGQLLVATPDIADPRFEHAVILIIAHDRDGAFGVTINRPVGKHPMGELLDAVGQKHGRVNGEVPIFAGGPIQEQVGFILHSTDYRDASTKAIGKGVSVTSSTTILKDMARGKGPKKTLIAFGFAGWLPGQLEAEVDKHAWVVAPLDARLIFDTDPEKIWDLAWAKRTLSI